MATRTQDARKFSESSLDKFATEFLRESKPADDNPETIEKSTQTEENYSFVLSTHDSIEIEPNSDDANKQLATTTKEKCPTCHGTGKQKLDSGESSNAITKHMSLARVNSDSDTFSVDSNGTVYVVPSTVTATDDTVSNLNEGQIVVVEPGNEFQPEESPHLTPAGYLECHLEVMYYLGVSPYRREEYKPIPEKVRIVQKIVFWIFSVISCAQFLGHAKNETLYVAVMSDLKYCVRFGFFVIQLLGRCFFIYLVSCLSAKVSIMLLYVRQMVQFQNDTLHHRFLKRTIGLVIGSILITCATVLLGYTKFSYWSIQESLQSRAYSMSITIFQWNTNRTIYDETDDNMLDECFDENITSIHIFMGLTEALFDFCATLQGDLIRDLLLLTAILLCSAWTYFEKRLEPMLLIHPNNATAAEVESCLRHYKALRQATATINETLQTVLNFHILENLFLYGYLVVRAVLDEKKLTRIIYWAIEATKATLMFYISLLSYRTNGKVSTWLRMMTTYKGPVNVEAILGMTVQAALDDIRDNPIGFGLDYFLINENFLMGFSAVVSSLISLLIQLENNT